MWPLTKKINPGSSSNQKGFFVVNSEQRGDRRWCEVQTWSASLVLPSKDPVHLFIVPGPHYPTAPKSSHSSTTVHSRETHLGPCLATRYWLFNHSSQSLRVWPTRGLVIRNSWVPPKPMASPGVGPRNLHFLSSLGSSTTPRLQTSIWEPPSHFTCFHVRNECQCCSYKTWARQRFSFKKRMMLTSSTSVAMYGWRNVKGKKG